MNETEWKSHLIVHISSASKQYIIKISILWNIVFIAIVLLSSVSFFSFLVSVAASIFTIFFALAYITSSSASIYSKLSHLFMVNGYGSHDKINRVRLSTVADGASLLWNSSWNRVGSNPIRTMWNSYYFFYSPYTLPYLVKRIEFGIVNRF